MKESDLILAYIKMTQQKLRILAWQVLEGNAQGAEEGDTDQDTEGEQGSEIILFIFVSLLLGTAVKHLGIYIKVPYTPILMIFGIALGISTKYINGKMNGAINQAQFISPVFTFYSHLQTQLKHLLLLIFLPALVFESSFGMSWHIFKKEFGKILLLAGPGVVVVAILEAIAFF